jgi:hypothetical protein
MKIIVKVPVIKIKPMLRKTPFLLPIKSMTYPIKILPITCPTPKTAMQNIDFSNYSLNSLSDKVDEII